MQSSRFGIKFFYLSCSHRRDWNLRGVYLEKKNHMSAEALTHLVEKLSRSVVFHFFFSRNIYCACVSTYSAAMVSVQSKPDYGWFTIALDSSMKPFHRRKMEKNHMNCIPKLSISSSISSRFSYRTVGLSIFNWKDFSQAFLNNTQQITLHYLRLFGHALLSTQTPPRINLLIWTHVSYYCLPSVPWW